MIRSFFAEVGAELLKTRRSPEFVIPTLLLPVAFYGFFAIAMSPGPQAARMLLATYGIFAVMGPAIFGFGIGVAQERESGWLAWRQAVPASRLGFILAKTVMTMAFGTVALALVYSMGGFVGEVAQTRGEWIAMFCVHLAAVVPFVLIGLALGFMLPSNAAVAVANLVFLFLAAIGGLWMPLFMMPEIIQTIAQGLPSYHLGQLALSASGQQPFAVINWAVPAGQSLVLLIITAWLARRQST